ncbi:GGDEF domain-containing protein [Marinicella gelatinilytica]|uniref:GGDEF domain-containing protein n=1 Tax=Marinicella gelatinilytica TaxID=2996017 RepID=UPI002260CDEC|nr:GGDEF domain-containing protein [Marinicella gelatinilytica]MCX7545589.1 GGDEF domain-containing protein [Marinicella gelatinilytica]
MNGISILTVDIVTMAFTRGIMQMMLGGLLLYLGSGRLNDRAAIWWALGFLLNGVSLFAFSIDVPEAWELFRNTLNHLSIGAASIFFLMGFWQFSNQPIKPWLLILLMVFPLTSIIAWEILWPNARYRVLCTVLGQVVYLIALQQALAAPLRTELARIFRRLRYAVIIYLVIFIWSYASLIEILPTTARQSLDYHRSIFTIASLLFMLTLAVGCLVLKFASLAARNSDLAMRDWLTGLLNRRGFFNQIESGNQANKDSSAISLLAIDIDHFKKINDLEGHAAGDLVLKRFAALLKSFDNDNRLIARMGGEEFLVTLYDSSEAEALALAEDIRRQVEQSKVLLSNQKTIQFTISIGVYQLGQHEKIEQGLTQADEALYKAKRQGRNQVVIGKNLS